MLEGQRCAGGAATCIVGFNREELKNVLTSFFKVCQPCFCIFHELKLLAQDTSVEIWDTHGPGSHAFQAIL